MMFSDTRRNFPVFVSVLVALAFWLASNPYIGIDHDAKLYVLMAYRWLSPQTYALDPWFAFGSQDDWSLFSPYLAVFLKVLGVEAGAMLATIFQGGLFAIAAVALGRAVLRGPHGDLAGWFIAAIPLLYSPNGMLHVAEGFVTARGLAVPLSMLALACAVRARPRWAALLAASAVLMHPIMGFLPAVLSFILSLDRKYDRRLLLLGCVGAVLFLSAGQFGWLPLVDDAWLPYVRPAGLVFIDQWWLRDIGSFYFQFGLVLAGALFAAPVRRRFYALVFFMSVLAVAVSYAAAYSPVVLVLQAQFWRGVWLVKVIALVALIDLVFRFVVRRRDAMREFRLLVMLLWMTMVMIVPGIAFLSVAVIRVAARWSREWSRHLARRYRWGVSVACILCAVVLLPHYLFGVASVGTYGGRYALESEFLMGLLRGGGLGLSPVLVWFLLRSRAMRLPFALIFPGSLLVLASAFWDVRSDQQRATESAYVILSSGLLPQVVAPGKTVYWHRNPDRVWFALGTSGYASEVHAIGLIFSRGRALVLIDRLRRVLLAYSGSELAGGEGGLELAFKKYQAGLKNFDEKVLFNYERRSGNQLSVGGVKLLCADQGLDFIIDTAMFNELSPALVSVPPATAGSRSLYLYACEMVRRRAQS